MAIHVGRSLDPSLAEQVAGQLMAHDATGAHARDELGMSDTLRARPIQAALASASSFAVGAAMPLLVTALAPQASLIIFVSGTSLLFLALLGALAARAGGSSVTASAIRVTFWGALAMGITAGVGVLFGTVVSRDQTRHANCDYMPIPSSFFTPRKLKLSAVVRSRSRLQRCRPAGQTDQRDCR